MAKPMVNTTIRLYGFVELESKAYRVMTEDQVEEVLNRELRAVTQAMKDDFWENFKK